MPSNITALPTAGAASAKAHDALRAELQALAGRYSIEVPAHTVAEFTAHPDAAARPMEVYVPALPNQSTAETVAACARLVQAGFVAVPHIAARSVARRADLEALLDQLAENAGVEKALLIGGDYDTPRGPFGSALEVLATGLFTKFGFREIAIASYPDGHRGISAPTLKSALRDKLAMGRQMGLSVAIVTQFTFEPDNIVAWGTQTLAAHGDLPIAVGLPGPARVGTLLRYAKRCGVQAALRAVTTYRSTTAQLLTASAPDRQMVALAKLALMRPGAWRPHFFTFGGPGPTLAWVDAVQAGRFQLDDAGLGFQVS